MSWNHCIELIVLKDVNKINYYINITIKNNYRPLHDKIKSREYERLDEETKSKLINQEQTIVSDFIKNPKPLQISIMFLDLQFDNIFHFQYS